MSHASRISAAVHSEVPQYERLAAGDDVRHGPDGLLHLRVGVGPVTVDEVYEVEAESVQRAVDGLRQVLAVQRVAHVYAVVDAPEQLGRQHVAMPGPTQLGDGLPHDPLRFTSRIRLSVVEEVHAGVVGGGQAIGGQVAGQLGPEGHPRAE